MFVKFACWLGFFINFANQTYFRLMNNYNIEVFMPMPACGSISKGLKTLLDSPLVERVWLWSASEVSVQLPSKCSLLKVGSLLSTALFVDMAERATAGYVLYMAKDNLEVEVERLGELCASMPETASMAYSHYRKYVGQQLVDAPTIDYLAGSLRNDFDFGPLLLFRTECLKKYLAEQLPSFEYAGLYQLRLAMSRMGSVYHHCDYVYAEQETDNRASGEKQFDYVNPAQRSVQIEMENVCTHHLKETGAWLPPCKYKAIDLSAGEFPVEASVIIPVLNRESTIGDAIKSVLAQRTSFKFNILVVDNHSTDRTGEIIDSFAADNVKHIVPESSSLGIGGCWNLAVNSEYCGRFAVQLDSDDIYSDENTLQSVVDGFYEQQCAMLVGTYRICDFDLNTLPPGIIDHREWSEENGRNNALRINGLGAPRAFFTPVIREVGFPNVSYGEDYAVGLQISRSYRIGRIYDVLYLCRRWGGNSDAALSHEKVNANNLYKDTLRTDEYEARREYIRSLSIPSGVELEEFFDRQLAAWPVAEKNYAELATVQQRNLENGLVLQYNPARMVSTGAKVDSAAIAARKCFLCAANRPAEQYAGSAMGTMEVLVNPFPVLPFHLTLPFKEHIPQLLHGMYADMLHISHKWEGMTVFYNGAKCGASAPDHAHLQAVRASDIPLLGKDWSERLTNSAKRVAAVGDAAVYHLCGYVVPLFVVVSTTVSGSVEMFSRLQASMDTIEGECEPRMNVLVTYTPAHGFVTIVVPRAQHRPACYSETGCGQRLVSPGTLDMAGLVVTPRECDFKEITASEAAGILREVAVDDETVARIIEKLTSRI